MAEGKNISPDIPANKIKWIINEVCNFKCDYCGIWLKERHPLKPVDVDQLKNGLDHLKGQWFFCIIGGEPFLERNFIEISQAISEKHKFGIITNLSTSNVIAFADNISPDRCTSVITSVHVAEREKKDPGLRKYVERMLYFQHKGFNISADYVAHPLLFNRIEADFDTFKSFGVKNVNIKMFIGRYNGKNYPTEYTNEQKALIENLIIDHEESNIMNLKHADFHGKLCYAGQRFFLMDREGNLKRCSSGSKNYGNLFEKSIKYDAIAKPCPNRKNLCLHECLENSFDEKGDIIPRIKEDFIENLLCIKKGINRKSSTLKKVICSPQIIKQYFYKTKKTSSQR